MKQTKAITIRYVIGLGLIALLALAGYTLLQRVVTTQESAAAVVNVSGRQRMLSQRIGLFSLRYVNSQTPEERQISRAALEEAVDLFETSHEGLLEGGIVPGFAGSVFISLPARIPSEVEALYFSEPILLDEQVTAYITAVDQLLAVPPSQLDNQNPDLQYILVEGSDTLLSSLNLAVTEYQLDSEQTVNRLQVVKTSVFILILAILALEGLLIFRPMTVQIVRRTAELEAQDAQLNEYAETLREANELGQQMTRLRSVEQVYQEAVNTLQSRFDLYYVQLYLLDQKDNLLRVVAGTGPVGTQLVQRGFRLAVGPGSINGTAASQKQTVLVRDTTVSNIFKPNALLPDTLSEIAVPLKIEDQVIGVLNLQSDQRDYFSDSLKIILEVIASQLSVTIQNARIMQQQVEKQQQAGNTAAQVIEAEWQNYLDGIYQPRSLSYQFDGQGVQAIGSQTAVLPSDQATQIPITVSGITIGQIEIVPAHNEHFSPDELHLMQQIADLVALRLENLRLLSLANRYREEAEAATRRLTREGWQRYQAELKHAGFEYDLNQVQALLAPTANDPTGLKQALTVRGEAFAQLEVLPEHHNNPTVQQMITAVAEQLSTHIESLRLTEQTETALAETETLYQIGTRLNSAVSVQEILNAIVDSPLAESFSTATFYQIDLDAHGRPQMLIPAATFVADRGNQTAVSVEPNEPSQLAELTPPPPWLDHPTSPLLVAEMVPGSLLGQNGMALGQTASDRSGSVAWIPLYVRGRWLGLIEIVWQAQRAFDQRDQRLFDVVADQASVVTNQLLLLEETQQRASNLSRLTQIENQLSRALTPANIVETVVGIGQRPYQASLCYFDADSDALPQTMEVISCWRNGRFIEPDSTFLPRQLRHNFVAQTVLTNDQPVHLLTELAPLTLPDGDQVPPPDQIRAMAIMPLRSAGRWQGVMTIEWDKDHIFSEREQFLFTQLAEPLSAIVVSQRALAETDALYRASAALNQANSYNEILMALRQHTRIAQDADVMNIGYFDRVATSENPPEAIQIVTRWSEGEISAPVQTYTLRDVSNIMDLLSTRLVIVPDIEESTTLNNPIIEIYRANNIRATIFLPLLVGGSWIGYVGLFYQKAISFSPTEIRRLEVLSRQAATAIQGIYLLRRSEDRARREQQLREIAARVHNSTNVESIMRTAVEEVGKALGRHATVYLESETRKNGR